MFKNFKLKQKFTILLLLVLIIGLTIIGGTLAAVLHKSTEDEKTSKALILMEMMNSVREYTDTQVAPELDDRIETEFLPETIPAYSATEVFANLRRQNSEYRNFFYKEAALNPSNLRDKADRFEQNLVQTFIDGKADQELRGFHSAPGGRLFYIARPIQITEESCLECHSDPKIAPKSVLERYGSVNGFGWKLNEIIGVQIIYVPASVVFERARQSFFLIMGIVSLAFIAVILVVNYLLNRNVIRPLKRMAKVAEEVSTGYMDAEFEKMSNDEIGNLAEAFKRMKMSLAMAMNRLSKVNRKPRG